MNVEFTEEQKMFRAAIRNFAQSEIAPLSDECEKNERFPVEILPKLGKMGYLCLTYSSKYGGVGLGKMGDCIEFEEIGRVNESIAATLSAQLGASISPFCDHGSEEQQQKYVVPVIRGEKIAAVGLTEPNAGSDVASIESVAKKNANTYILNGTKNYVTGGTICDFVTVAAYTDKSKKYHGMSLIVIDKGTPGLSATKLHKFCHRSSDTAEIAYEDCVVPEENLIGEEGKGFRYAMESLIGQRINHAAARIGGAEAALQDALDYAQQRVQFGRPIATFQAIAFKLARIATEIEAARWLVYNSAWLFDQGKPCDKESSMAKFLVSEVYQRASIEAMEIFGGAASLEESRVNRYYRDSYLGKITEGTSEIQELVIARQLGIRGIQ